MTSELPKMQRRRRVTGRGGATLRDVARAAGVSTASASRALARPQIVSDALRNHVVRVAEELGYVPNAAARALAAQRSGVIGVIAGPLEDVFSRRATEALSQRLHDAGYAVYLTSASGDSENTVSLVHRALARGADALALVGVDLPEDPSALCEGRTLPPMACLDQPTPGRKFAAFARAQALELAIRFLRELGHRRIGVIAPGRACRIADIGDALSAGDMTLIGLARNEGQESQRGGSERPTQWLGLPHRLSALVCGSDAAAAAVLRDCEAHGVAVPQQLSIMGFGDTDLARHTRPALSTLRIPADQAGVAAADFLLATLRGEAFVAPKLTTKVVARESTCHTADRTERPQTQGP